MGPRARAPLAIEGGWVLARECLIDRCRPGPGPVGGRRRALRRGPLGQSQRAESTQRIANDATTIAVARVCPAPPQHIGDRPDLLRTGVRTEVDYERVRRTPVVLIATLTEPMIVILHAQ